MRLQIRVTPANQELLDHLENVDREYRGKRLIALAAMQLAQMNRVVDQSAIPDLPKVEVRELGNPEASDKVSAGKKILKAPGWSANGLDQ